MAANEDLALMAHLMRRAGFGATREELERRVEAGYEETVEELLDFDRYPPVDQYTLFRYHPISEMPGGVADLGQANWIFHMLNTQRPLEEKLTLFWHQVFATGNNKVDNCTELLNQIAMLREYGMGSFRDLLVRLARNPAMIFWLDNNENHKYAVNENWGRELLELFAMGVGNYTEQDVYECSRAFTGWTFVPGPPRNPYNRFRHTFEYLAEDHDFNDKSFLGHTDDLNGEDAIDVIVQQPACHLFIARHLYNFFVADEPQVPSWTVDPPRDPEAVEELADVFVRSGYEVRPVLRSLFNSDYFKSKASWYQKVKSPIETVVGTLKLVGEFQGPAPGLFEIVHFPGYAGQEILDPPSVEGWHTGHEWINSGAIVQRINFVADRVANTELPGVKDLVARVAGSNGAGIQPADMVDACLDLLGPMEVEELTHTQLVTQAATEGRLSWGTDEERENSSRRVADMLALIAATKEYQFG